MAMERARLALVSATWMMTASGTRVSHAERSAAAFHSIQRPTFLLTTERTGMTDARLVMAAMTITALTAIVESYCFPTMTTMA